ncbi:hypothetical protein ATO6_18790 [Oceanicola sp. 22II-s10i]|nr:hypothetical protein ATO6_18790 [Oceanicola sp. 22II-s10i]
MVGMAARLPGGIKLDDFWSVIREGRSVIERFDPSEAEDSYDAATRAGSNYVPARSIMRDPDKFDAKFFNMRPREAELTDPQGRVFLEVCQEALDNAGIDPDRTQVKIGIFAGSSMSTYMLENLLANRAEARKFTTGFQLDYSVLSGNDQSLTATRVAYRLGLTGPAISVNTACSTSLVAINMAVEALRAGDADVMMAGGVSITFPQKRGYLFLEGGMASPDGLCRPFDANAGGTVFGHGAGAVVLKRLGDALRDGDHIHAVIRGVGLNNDGAAKMSFTAPSVQGQTAAVRMAQADAGVTPDQVGYVECHGTATPLGDPIEVSGLKQAFGTTGARTALGSVKGNVGHLDAAAGVVSVIKLALMMQKRELPPIAHFRGLNPRIDLGDTPFFVPEAPTEWVSDGARIAGVSSFGVGGTNAHAIIEEAPALADRDAPRCGMTFLPLSAKSPEAVVEMARSLADRIEADAALYLPDVAHTLQQGRRVHDWRAVTAGADRPALVTALREVKAPKAAVKDEVSDVVFLFPGQGSQYPGMGADLYDSEPEYARWIDRGAEILEPIMGRDMRNLILGRDLSQDEAAAALRETWITQPALFLTEFALAKLWQSRGIEPTACIGHSVGEFVAAALTGVMSFEDALTLIAKRGHLMQDQPGGAMLSVRAPMEALKPFLDDSTDLAARNAPKLQVVAGPFAAIDALEARLSAADIACQRLHTSHAFHSQMMDPVGAPLREAAAAITLNAPDRPIVSAVTGRELTAAEACDPAYWADQARACVNFQAALEAVTQTRSPVFVEVGPGRTLSAFAAQTLDRSSHRGLVQTLPDHTQPVSDDFSMAAAVSSLWSAGLPVDWTRQGPVGSRKVPLPPYPFQRQSYWIAPKEDAPAAVPAPVAPVVQPSEGSVMTDLSPNSVPAAAPADRMPRLVAEIAALLADMSGEDIGTDVAGETFLELGFDSLFMGQVSQAIGRQYGVEIGFRRLLADVSTITLLAQHLDAEMPANAAPEPAPQPVAAQPAPVAPAPVAQPMPAAVPAATASAPVAGLEGIMKAQIDAIQAVFAQQLQALGSGVPAQAAAPQPVAAPAAQPAPQPVAAPAPAPVAANAPAKPAEAEDKPAGLKFGRGPNVTGGTMTEAQVAFARDLAARYSAKHPGSKAYAAKHRKVHADPRTAAGFRADWKELVFPIVAERAKGAYLHDVDGNTFVDVVNGFGQTAFGHSPDFVTEAVARQMEKGFPIGPQAELAGPLAEKFARFVGHERVTFCNTGSEAVMAAMRVARTVTGRDLIVVFDKDYHGQFDEVLVKGRARGTDPSALPSAPGIPRSSLANMKVLTYGAPEALDWIRDNMRDIAAVIVEPVQSRHPAHRPADFVREIRRLTRDGGAALVMDEIVTGFRTHARGMQGVWDIKGDMATYGKVVGGGMPVGVLAGDARFMDSLDGGNWNYGDDSKPEAIPTFFAGTFVRHPLVLAAVDASLDFMIAEGDRLWKGAADRCADVAGRMNAAMAARGLPQLVETYSSWFVIQVTEADPRASLLYPLMRMEGVHVMDGFCGFITTAHTDADCDRVVAAFETALDSLLSVGILADLRKDPAAPLPAAKPFEPLKGVPLTEGQREIWMSHQMGGAAAAAFNESTSLVMNGTLDKAALQTAFDAVIARHDALRLRFARDGSTVDVMAPETNPIGEIDLSAEADPQAALADAIAADSAIGFDITAEAPIRAFLAKLGTDRHVMVICAHHIVADGWSFGVMLDDLARLYSAAHEGRQAGLAPAPSFAAHAQAEAARMANPSTMAYWKSVYDTPVALPDLPLVQPRPERRSHTAGTVFHEIGLDTVKAARKAGAKQGCTLFATAFGAMQMLVHRLSGTRDVVLGVPTAQQQNLPNPALVGHCVNFLPVRATIAENVSVAEHLKLVSARLNEAFEHGDTTLGAIVRDLAIPRQINRLPLTEIEFNLEKQSDASGMSGLDASFHANAKTGLNFDLFFNVVETPQGLRIEAHYNADVLDAATVAGWTRAYESILTQIAASTDQQVATLSLTGGDEADAVIDGVQMAFDREATLTTFLGTRMAQFADAMAVEDAAGRMTYAELNTRADALAALVQAQVPGRNARVALSMTRGRDMLAGLLAILRAGHTYVPLDPRQPSARLKQIAETAEVAAVLTDTPENADFAADAGKPVILASEAQAGTRPAPVTVSAEDAAYVIFTSGSTGTPKGVAVPHRAAVNFLTSMAAEPGLTAADRMLAVTTVMFDIAALELFLPLSVGAGVVIARTEDVIDGFKLVERLNQGDVTVMQATPTLWDMVLTAGFTPNAGFRMLCGGEPLPADLAARLTQQGAELWNMYGPTETTIWSAVRRILPGEPITIGHPIANTQLVILDSAGQPVPEGATGELNIGGDGLAIGYHGRPDLTDKAFRDITVAGQTRRLYATGDLARRRPDGEVEVLGRIDTQVKLRGFRIELGEIETALRAIPGVDKAAVDLRARGSGDKQLVGYVVAEDGAAPEGAELTAKLAEVLPDYMIPRAWVMLSALPQTGNGKLDRKALPDPQDTASVTPLREAAEPETETERRIAAIWGEVLGRDRVGVTDTLFALGVDSLAVFRIAARMLNAGLNLEARHMFAHPSIRELAAFHDGRGGSTDGPAKPSLKDFRAGARRAGRGGAK